MFLVICIYTFKVLSEKICNKNATNFTLMWLKIMQVPATFHTLIMYYRALASRTEATTYLLKCILKWRFHNSKNRILTVMKVCFGHN